MSEELKPCPFCGPHEYFKPELIYRGLEGHHDIVCPQCGAKKWCEAWERRPIEDALRAEVAALQGAVNDAMALVLSHEGHIDKMNERAEQAGAEWTRAREAWKAFSGNDPDAVAILDQFFGSDER